MPTFFVSLFFNIASLIALFVILGLAADLAVKNIKYLALVLRIRLFALGIILGISTTLPELSVGINAIIKGIPGVSVGNILGGISVVMGLILGVSLILHKKISTEDSLKPLIPATIVILSPFILGLDGKFSLWEGLVMIALYLFLILYLHKINPQKNTEQIVLIERKKVAKALFLSLIGIIIVLISSNVAVDISTNLLDKTGISRLLMGLLFFSIGTNLPEITIALTAWRRKSSELSVSFLLSSSFTNILVLGILSVFRPIVFSLDIVFYSLAFFLFLIMSCFVFFSHTDKSLSRREGFVLLFIYLAFLVFNIFLAGR